MQKLDGYKTYIVAAATILFTGIQLWAGQIDTQTAIFAVLGALGLGGLRHGMTQAR
jgi:type IV secretory pathway VirB2 component (pilin)